MNMSQYETFKTQANEAIADKDFEKAKVIWEQAIEAEPNNPDPYIDLGNIYKVSKLYPQAEQFYHQALEHQPDYWRAYHNLGGLYNVLKKPEIAIPYLEKALETCPDPYLTFVNLISAYTDLNNEKEVFYFYQKAIEFNSIAYEAKVALGRFYVCQKRWQEAVEILENNFEIIPKIYLLGNYLYHNYFLLGETYFFGFKEYDKALNCFKKAIEIEPKNFSAYSNMGWIYSIKGDFEAAMVHYGLAVDINPSLENDWMSMIWLCGRFKESELALKISKMALSHLPKQDGILYYTGMSHVLLGQYDQAIDYIKKAIDISPEEPIYRCWLGLLLEKINHWKEALVEFRLSCKLINNEAKYNLTFPFPQLKPVLEKHGEKELLRVFSEKEQEFNRN